MSYQIKYAIVVMLLFGGIIFGYEGGVGYFADLHSAEIARTGIETTAHVSPYGVPSTQDISDGYYYSISFDYTDENGNSHSGKTNVAYDYDEASQICHAGELQIKYNDKFEAVAADFKYSHDFGSNAGFFYVGLVVGVLGAIYCSIVTTRLVSTNRAKNKGNLTTATFVKKVWCGYSFGHKIYHIVYKYVPSEEGGKERTVKSKETFELEDALYFETIKEFNIKYLGKTAVITEQLDSGV